MNNTWAVHDGLIKPVSIIKPKQFPVAVDLFAGCGGMSLGLMQAGFRIAAAVDNDPNAALTFMYNLGTYPCRFIFVSPKDEKSFSELLEREMQLDKKTNKIGKAFISGQGWLRSNPGVPGCGVFFLGDIREIIAEDILREIGMKKGELDLVCGGPPCQGFSTAGKQNIMDPRNSLIFEFARFILDLQPKTMVMENVPGIVSMLTPEGVPVLDKFVRILEDGNFGLADALKKSLLQSSGAGAAMSSQRRSKKKLSTEKEDQLKMF